MRDKLAAAAIACAGVVLLGAGGTYAAFTDTEAAAPVLVRGGTLDLVLSTEHDQVTEPLTFSDVVPGPVPARGTYQPSAYFYFVKLTNDGSVAGVAKWATQGVAEYENGCNAPELESDDQSCGAGGDQGELGDQLAVSFSLLPGTECTGTPGVVPPEQYPATRTADFRPIKPGGAGPDLLLAPGSSRCVRIDVHFPSTAQNNIAQTDSSVFQLRFRLDQA